jgi:hypothetical protein
MGLRPVQNRFLCIAISPSTMYPMRATESCPLQTSITIVVALPVAGGVERSMRRGIESMAANSAAHQLLWEEQHIGMKRHRQERRQSQKEICGSSRTCVLLSSEPKRRIVSMSLTEMYRAYIASGKRLWRLTAEATQLPTLPVFSPHISSQPPSAIFVPILSVNTFLKGVEFAYVLVHNS